MTFIFLITLIFYNMISYGSIYFSKMISILLLWGFPLHLLSRFRFLDRIFLVVLKYFVVSIEICSFFISLVNLVL